MKPVSRWNASKGLARGILHDRELRRKMLGRCALLMLAVFAVGLWGIDGWLAGNPWRFLIWWSACGALTVFVIVFALYDALRVIQEERDRP